MTILLRKQLFRAHRLVQLIRTALDGLKTQATHSLEPL